MEKQFTYEAALDRSVLASTLLAAFEGGIRHWAKNPVAIFPDGTVFSDEENDFAAEYGMLVLACFKADASVELTDHGGWDDEVDHKTVRFGSTKIRAALSQMQREYPRTFAVLLTGGDTESGDVLVQYAALGEVQYQ